MGAVYGSPMRRLLPAALILAALLTLSACGAEKDGTFDESAYPFTFTYPDGFQESDDVTVSKSLGGGGSDAKAVLTEEHDGIFLFRYDLSRTIDQSNLDQAAQEFTKLFRSTDPTASATKTEVGGLPALEINVSNIPGVDNGESRIIAVFQGDQEYFINCQSTPDHRDDVEAACDQALDTLTLK